MCGSGGRMMEFQADELALLDVTARERPAQALTEGGSNVQRITRRAL